MLARASVASDALEEGNKDEALKVIAELNEWAATRGGHWPQNDWETWSEKVTAAVIAGMGVVGSHEAIVFVTTKPVVGPARPVGGSFDTAKREMSLWITQNTDAANIPDAEANHGYRIWWWPTSTLYRRRADPSPTAEDDFYLGYWMETIRMHVHQNPAMRKNPGEVAQDENRWMMAGRFYGGNDYRGFDEVEARDWTALGGDPGSVGGLKQQSAEAMRTGRASVLTPALIGAMEVASDTLTEALSYGGKGEIKAVWPLVDQINEESQNVIAFFHPKKDLKEWSMASGVVYFKPFRAYAPRTPVTGRIVFVTSDPDAMAAIERFASTHTIGGAGAAAMLRAGYTYDLLSDYNRFNKAPSTGRASSERMGEKEAERWFYLGYWMEVLLMHTSQLKRNPKQNPPQWDDIHGWTRKGQHDANTDMAEVIEMSNAQEWRPWSEDQVSQLAVAMDLLEEAGNPEDHPEVKAAGGPHALAIRGPGKFHDGLEMLRALRMKDVGTSGWWLPVSKWTRIPGYDPRTSRIDPDLPSDTMVYKDHVDIRLESPEGDAWMVGYWRTVYETITESTWGHRQYPLFAQHWRGKGGTDTDYDPMPKLTKNPAGVVEVPITREKLRAELDELLVRAGIAPDSVRLTFSRELDREHGRHKRTHAQVVLGKREVQVAQAILKLDAAHRLGILAHEVGHICCLATIGEDHSEDQANRAAMEATQVLITYDRSWPGHHPDDHSIRGLQVGTDMTRMTRNPARALDDAGEAAVAKYEEFHRYAPKSISSGDLKIPRRMVTAGKAIFVTYESAKVDPETLKKPRAAVPYIHELEAGTVLYLNEGDVEGGQGDAEVPAEFRNATALTRLGVCLGFAFKGDDGEQVEAEGTAPMPELYCTPCGRCLMVVQSKKSVIAMIWGGGLAVENVGIVG